METFYLNNFFQSDYKNFIRSNDLPTPKNVTGDYNVTRFGEILPLWQKFTSLWQKFNGLFLIWQNAEHTLANLQHYWTNFHCCKWPNLEKYYNHLVTLSVKQLL